VARSTCTARRDRGRRWSCVCPDDAPPAPAAARRRRRPPDLARGGRARPRGRRPAGRRRGR
jgi:hypothetical protein